jgi:membrane protein involved in colicin uptake
MAHTKPWARPTISEWRPLTAPQLNPTTAPNRRSSAELWAEEARRADEEAARAAEEAAAKKEAEAEANAKSFRRRRRAVGDAEAAAARAATSHTQQEKDKVKADASKSFRKKDGRRSSALRASSAAKALGLEYSGRSAGVTSHGNECSCLPCMRRQQLLMWRDTMQDAQRQVDEVERWERQKAAERAALAAEEEALGSLHHGEEMINHADMAPETFKKHVKLPPTPGVSA